MKELSSNEKAELLRDWRLATVQDKGTIELLSQLYNISVTEVENMIEKNKRGPKFEWTTERVHRLRTLMQQGYGNTYIANQLGCRIHCVANYKNNHKSELPDIKAKQKAEHRMQEEISKKKEPSTAGTAESSEKNTITEVGSSAIDYNTMLSKCQAKNDKLYSDIFCLSGKMDDFELLLRDLISYFDFNSCHYLNSQNEMKIFFECYYDVLAANVVQI